MIAPAGHISLHDGKLPTSVDRSHVYFTFGSGRFHYDCITCGAQCCRGFGFQVAKGGELSQRVKATPALRIFIASDAHSPALRQVRNCAPGCFFLDAAGRCGVQLREGYDAKPETCRLFPFNNLTRVGDYLIVGPHDSLCPLIVQPRGSSSAASNHEQLFESMSAGGIRVSIPESRSIAAAPARMIDLEREIVAWIEAAPSDVTYEAATLAQLDLTRGIVRPSAPSPGERGGGGLTEFVTRVCDILGAQPSPTHRNDSALVHTMLAVTPHLRAQLVFHRFDATHGVATALDRVPYLLIALHLLLALAREAGMQTITYQTVTQLFREQGPVLRLLAYADCEMTWHPNASIDFSVDTDPETQERYLAVVDALLPRSRRRSGATLGDILFRLAPDDDGRMPFLSYLATRLVGRIEPVGQPTTNDHPRRLRSMVQRWIVGNVPHRFLINSVRQI